MSPDVGRFIRTASLVTAVALGAVGVQEPQPIEANHIHPGSSETLEEKTSKELALSVMGQYVNFGVSSYTEWIGRNLFSDPEEFMEIVGPSGAGEFYVPDNKNRFFVYANPTIDGIETDILAWSIQVVTENNSDLPETAIHIQLNYFGQMFQGFGDWVAEYGTLPITAKGLQAGYLFNIPDEMEMSQWATGDGGRSHQRSFFDQNGNILTQNIDASNVISLVIQPITP